MRSEEPSHKVSILWHNGFLDTFLHRSPKTTLKKPQNLPLNSILKLTFPEIFKNESYRFSQFSRNFINVKFPFYGTLGFFTCFSVDPRKQHSKIPKITSLCSILKLTFPEIFEDESFRFSQYSQNFFSDLCLGSSDCLTNY